MDMAAQPDLWGEIQIPNDVRTPLAILREQAALLGPKTQNLVEAEVDTEPYGSDLRHRFYLIAPALDNYRYQLFEARHEVTKLYPVVIDYSTRLATQDELMDWLKNRLSSPETRQVITTL